MFPDQSTFQKIIEEIVYMEDISYLEAVVKYCHDNSIDAEDIRSLFSPNLKDKIRMDAVADGLMKREAMLPL
jgi:hypothetical protein